MYLICVFAAQGDAHSDRAAGDSILEILQTPFESVDDVAARLQLLEEILRDAGDPRAVFTSVYVVMTRRTKDHIESGFFLDEAWSRSLTVAFADNYRRALLDFERGNLNVMPGAWRIAFEVSGSESTSVFRNALLAIHAHVNHDLALAVYEVGADPHRFHRHFDFTLVNLVLWRATDEIEDTLAEKYDPGIADIDEAFGRIDEIVANRVLARWRSRAWDIGVLMSSIEDDRVLSFLLGWLDYDTARAAQKLAGSNP